MVRVCVFAAALILAALAGVSPANAQAGVTLANDQAGVTPANDQAGVMPAIVDVVAHVSLSAQKMTVVVDGVERHVWPVSTARRGKRTPVGIFRPQVLVRMHYSSLYDNAPMPWSIFFHGNYAIHGTAEVRRLGTPASAGCVRLHPDHARALFALVRERGLEKVKIVLESGRYAGRASEPDEEPKT